MHLRDQFVPKVPDRYEANVRRPRLRHKAASFSTARRGRLMKFIARRMDEEPLSKLAA
jgi:hypothetical protein